VDRRAWDVDQLAGGGAECGPARIGWLGEQTRRLVRGADAALRSARMNIVFLLIPLGMVLVVGAAAALIWAVDSGQYDGELEDKGRIAIEPDEPHGPQ
jgi:cbb3-type cytochrome oxidase maturation protein